MGVDDHDLLADAFFAYLARERRYSLNTARAYLADVRGALVFAAQVGEADPHTWGADLIRAHLARCHTPDGKRVSAATRARKLSALKTFFAWLLRDASDAQKNRRQDIFAALQAPKIQPPLPRPLDVEATVALLQTPSSTDDKALRNHAALLLLYGLGLRLAEAASLRDEDLDLRGASALVRGKGDKDRLVPVPSGCIPGLCAYRAVRSPAGAPTYLVGRGSGKRLATRTIARIVDQAARVALGRRVSPHQLRHSFATHLLANGAGLREIQAALGHANLATTQRYTLVSPQALAETHARTHPRG